MDINQLRWFGHLVMMSQKNMESKSKGEKRTTKLWNEIEAILQNRTIKAKNRVPKRMYIN